MFHEFPLHIQVAHFGGVLLDEPPSRVDLVAHQDREYPVGLDRVLELDLQQAARVGIHRRLPQLSRIHLAQALVTLDLNALGSDLAHAIEHGAARVIVLPTGFTCELHGPPETSLAMALHAVNLLLARQMVRDVERYGEVADIRIVPPLCPVATIPHDFSNAGELIARSLKSTTKWIEEGGLERAVVPPQIRLHPHSL